MARKKETGTDGPTKSPGDSTFTERNKEGLTAARRQIITPSKIRNPKQQSKENLYDKDVSWNIFDPVETKTTLRPRSYISRWDRGDRGAVEFDHQSEEEDGDNAVYQKATADTPGGKNKKQHESLADDDETPKKRKRPHRSSLPNQMPKLDEPAEKEGKIPQVVQSSKIRPHESDSDSDVPLLRKRRCQPQLMTTGESNVLPTTPNVRKRTNIVDLEDDAGLAEYARLSLVPQSQQKAQAVKIKTEGPNSDAKVESLSVEMISCTYLRVSADNMVGKGPVRVPFELYKTSERLFTSLMSERKIRHDQRPRVSDITATFPWSKESIGIRKGRYEDWTYFCECLRKAWVTESHRFGEGCNVDIMIHVDEN